MSSGDSTEHSNVAGPQDVLSRFVRLFLDSNLSAILIVFSVLVGLAALFITPREEDPQIVVPLADIYVNFPGHTASEVEQLVATPLERVLYQIDGVEYVYSMSRENQAIITVRFYVGQDRERSLVKLFKKIDENIDVVPPGVAGWVVKPVEIDDVPVVTLTLTGDDSHNLRRVGEEAIERLSTIPEVSRAFVIGGEPRTVRIDLDAERLRGHNISPLELERAIRGANVTLPAGVFTRNDASFHVDAGVGLVRPEELKKLVVGVANGRPVFLQDVAQVDDGPAEIANYVRHGWGPARGFAAEEGHQGSVLGAVHSAEVQASNGDGSASKEAGAVPAVTLALSKKKGTNAVQVADKILRAAEQLKHDFLPDNISVVITRNYGLTANEKVNELIEALAVAILIVIALLTLSLGWREAFIVAVAVPVVFGLTLAVNLVSGYSINRVTLFALILSLGLLVDDPIVDVENISRHFQQAKRATRGITLAAVAEIRPPLISATLAVIVSFLPLLFITGMMGPYMAPMALNVPVAMLMSMLVAFTITPWLTFHMLKGHFGHSAKEPDPESKAGHNSSHELYDPAEIQRSILYRIFRPLMAPLLTSRFRAAMFLLAIGGLTVAAMGLAATRSVPLKMLPFDNKNELLFMLDFAEGTTLERASAAVQNLESYFAKVPEVTDFTSYVGVSGPIDFNGLVRHYYLRQAPELAEVRVNLVGKKNRHLQSHAIALRMRDELTKIAEAHGAALKIVELPPGPPVLASVVAEVYGKPDQDYTTLLNAADVVAARFRKEPGMVDVDSIREVPAQKLVFVTDQEKAALAGVSVDEVARTIRLGLEGADDQTLRVESERHPLRITIRLPRSARSNEHDLAALYVKGAGGQLVPISEIGDWKNAAVSQTIYHKNLERVVYVFAETVGRPPAECIADVATDRTENAPDATNAGTAAGATPKQFFADGSYVTQTDPRATAARTYFTNGGGILWATPTGTRVSFSGEGEWKITIDVFRDLGLAFGAAMLMIYVILVAQTGSFLVPVIVMLAIPLTVLGVMPGFWLLNFFTGHTVGGYADPVFFTATAMIGMIALAGIVTRDSIILVDFIQLARNQGRSLFDAIMESRVVRLRPILLTAGAAMLSSVPITLDPIFSGLGWSLIFGLFASTVFTMFVIPVCFWLVYDRAQ
jgi:multidrug efflux pump subunit AcrB